MVQLCVLSFGLLLPSAWVSRIVNDPEDGVPAPDHAQVSPVRSSVSPVGSEPTRARVEPDDLPVIEPLDGVAAA
jgi:hypothetical protein